MSNQNLHVKFEGDGQQKTLLIGQALTPREKDQHNVEGDISAPADYAIYRKPDPKFAHVQINSTARTILFVVDENDELSHTVKGSLELAPELSYFPTGYSNKKSLQEFRDLIKSGKRFMRDESEYQSLLKMLTDFKAHAEIKASNQKDDRGNLNQSVEVRLNTGVAENLNIKVPIFVGTDPVPVTLQICCEANNTGQITFWLLSPELDELIDEMGKKLLQEQAERFKGAGPVLDGEGGKPTDYLIMKVKG